MPCPPDMQIGSPGSPQKATSGAPVCLAPGVAAPAGQGAGGCLKGSEEGELVSGVSVLQRCAHLHGRRSHLQRGTAVAV
eukprot:gene47748-2293_t